MEEPAAQLIQLGRQASRASGAVRRSRRSIRRLWDGFTLSYAPRERLNIARSCACIPKPPPNSIRSRSR